MIDIHSHILPGIDDGARNIEESLTMLEIAIGQGVTTQVLTPHIHIGKFNNTKNDINAQFTAFVESVDSANLNIKLLLGAEVRIGPEVMQLISMDGIPWLGEKDNKRTFLLEFPRGEVPYGSDNLVRWLISKNCLPVIVHPERNNTFLVNRSKLGTFLDLGCPIQITASSLTGKFGADVQKMTEELLLAGSVSAIASDCHNLKGRKPDLLDGFEKACSIIGKDEASKLVNSKPSELISKNSYS